jgi:opacity protein-like surface antigen
MKKLALVLVASTVSLGSTQANITTGFYLGGAVGSGATTANATGQNIVAVPGSTNVGTTAFNFGIMGGYGWVFGCMYYGGELGYAYENTKVNDTTTQRGGFDSSQLKRTGYFNAALRGGYLFTPNTMLYIRLGINWGKWSLRDSLNNGFSMAQPGSGSKNRPSFVPGFGIETAVHRHVYLRVEYVYEFGPGVRATNGALPNRFTNMGTLRTQSGKLGVSYKF